MTKSSEDIMSMFGQMMGDKKYDKFGYHCNKCSYELDQMTFTTPMKENRKLFYCKNNRCERFGIVTVVAKKKAK